MHFQLMSLAFMKQLRILMMEKKRLLQGKKKTKPKKFNIWKNYFTHH